jgi:hypothetical protein
MPKSACFRMQSATTNEDFRFTKADLYALLYLRYFLPGEEGTPGLSDSRKVP